MTPSRKFSGSEHRQRRSSVPSFTLIELVIVLGIMVLVGAVVFISVGKKPTFVVLDDASASIEAVLLQGSIQSLAQGKEISVTYDPESKSVNVNGAVGETSIPGMEKSVSKYFSYAIPEDVDIECESLFMNELPSFKFFPDGTAIGPDLITRHKGHTFLITVSPLTGMINRNYINEP